MECEQFSFKAMGATSCDWKSWGHNSTSHETQVFLTPDIVCGKQHKFYSEESCDIYVDTTIGYIPGIYA